MAELCRLAVTFRAQPSIADIATDPRGNLTGRRPFEEVSDA
jgi:hypothetical protein